MVFGFSPLLNVSCSFFVHVKVCKVTKGKVKTPETPFLDSIIIELAVYLIGQIMCFLTITALKHILK